MHGCFASSFYQLMQLEYIHTNRMKKRVRINVSDHLNDLELIQPHFFQQPTNTNPTLPSNKTHPTFIDIKEPRNILPTDSQKGHNKKTSLDVCPIEDYSESAKEQLKEDSYSENMEIEREDANSVTQIAGLLVSQLKTQKTRVDGKRKKKFQLKEIIKRQKVNNICSKFIEKLHRNNCKAQAVDFKGFEIQQKQSFLQEKGYQINKAVDHTIASLSIVQIICLFLAYTLALVFPQVSTAPFIGTLQYFSIVFYLIQIIYNCATVKANAGKKLITYQEILWHYFQTNMIIDVISLMILLVDCGTTLEELEYLRLFIIAKLPQCLEKMEKLQAFFIKNYYNEQYWSLIKVILFNFCFAHLLAIALTAMGNINADSTSWQTVKGIQHASWFQKYTWAYYWGTTIMLTIGFGDITATTYQEALCLIVIEIFSVMCLAYNINSVGTLISNIRSQDIEKSKNYKTFKQLSDKYELSSQLQWKINHYIEESVNIRKKFNLEEENTFLHKLPSDLKKEYLKQSNRSIFYHLTFFGNLIDKTLYAFAQHIEMSISHPEQTLRRLDDQYNLLILRQGQVGFTSKKRSCSFNDMIIDRVKVQDVKKPFLLGLQFLTRRRPNYEIKSLQYSVIYYLEYDNLIKNLKESQMDYHHFCFMRDKDRTVIDQFQVYPCEYCPKRFHTKFACPKLHFMPLKQLVIYKQHQKERKGRNARNSDPQGRIPTDRINALVNYKIISRVAQQENARHNAKHKQSNPFLDRLSQLKRIQSEAVKEDSTNLNNDQLLLKYTSQVIKLEFNRFKISENFEDEVWTISCDKMKNFKEYFPECNPCILEEKFNLEERLKFICSNMESNSFITSKSPTISNFSKVTSTSKFHIDYSQEI